MSYNSKLDLTIVHEIDSWVIIIGKFLVSYSIYGILVLVAIDFLIHLSLILSRGTVAISIPIGWVVYFDSRIQFQSGVGSK